jgi:hypothetical protein
MVNMGVEPRTLALLAPRSKPTELIDRCLLCPSEKDCLSYSHRNKHPPLLKRPNGIIEVGLDTPKTRSQGAQGKNCHSIEVGAAVNPDQAWRRANFRFQRSVETHQISAVAANHSLIMNSTPLPPSHTTSLPHLCGCGSICAAGSHQDYPSAGPRNH